MMAANYTTLAQVKTLLPDSRFTTAHEDAIEAIIGRVSRLVDTYTQREPGAYYVTASETRYFDGNGKAELWVDEMAAAPTKVSVAESGEIDPASGTGGDYTEWADTDYFLWPSNALKRQEPYLRLDIDTMNGSKTIWYRYARAVKITAQWGFSSTAPDDIKTITEIETVRIWKSGAQQFQDVGAIEELGQLEYVKALHPKSKEVLEKYRQKSYF
jgi:hypothetical protein